MHRLQPTIVILISVRAFLHTTGAFISMEVHAQVVLPRAPTTEATGGRAAADGKAPGRPATTSVPAAAAAPATVPAGGRSAWWSPLRALTSGSRTNADMLLFRTLNRDMGAPNANADILAPLFRDALAPMRSRWFAAVPGARTAFRRALEHPKLGAPGVVNWVDARTSAIDAAVQAAVDDGLTQVVVVAAGFDTRSYRFGAAAQAFGRDVAFFEVDLPGASSSKKQKLVEALLPATAYPRPTFVPADLSVTPLMDALEGAGFNFTVPALFTIEGLIYYLPEPRVIDLLAAIAARTAPGTRVVFDALSADILSGVPPPPAYKVTARSVANKGEPFVSGLPSDATGLQGFLDGPVAVAAAAASELGGPLHRLKLTDFCTARELAARHLPHLDWPSGPGSVPPILSFYNFCSASVEPAM